MWPGCYAPAVTSFFSRVCFYRFWFHFAPPKTKGIPSSTRIPLKISRPTNTLLSAHHGSCQSSALQMTEAQVPALINPVCLPDLTLPLPSRHPCSQSIWGLLPWLVSHPTHCVSLESTSDPSYSKWGVDLVSFINVFNRDKTLILCSFPCVSIWRGNNTLTQMGELQAHLTLT